MPDGTPVEELKITSADVAAANRDVSARINILDSERQALEGQIKVDPTRPVTDQSLDIKIGTPTNIPHTPDVAGLVTVHTAESTARPQDATLATTQPAPHIESEPPARPEHVGILNTLRNSLAGFFNSGRQRDNVSSSDAVIPEPDTAPLNIKILPESSPGRDTAARPSTTAGSSPTISPAPANTSPIRIVNNTEVRTVPVDAGPAAGSRAAEAARIKIGTTLEPASVVTVLSPAESVLAAARPAETLTPATPEPSSAAADHLEPPQTPAEVLPPAYETHLPEGNLNLTGFDAFEAKINTDGRRDLAQILKIVSPVSDEFKSLIGHTDFNNISREVGRESSDDGPKATYKLSITNSHDEMTATVSRGKVEVTESYGPEDTRVSKTYKVVNETNDPYQKRFYEDGEEITDSTKKQELWNKLQSLGHEVILYATNMDSIRRTDYSAS